MIEDDDDEDEYSLRGAQMEGLRERGGILRVYDIQFTSLMKSFK